MTDKIVFTSIIWEGTYKSSRIIRMGINKVLPSGFDCTDTIENPFDEKRSAVFRFWERPHPGMSGKLVGYLKIPFGVSVILSESFLNNICSGRTEDGEVRTKSKPGKEKTMDIIRFIFTDQQNQESGNVEAAVRAFNLSRSEATNAFRREKTIECRADQFGRFMVIRYGYVDCNRLAQMKPQLVDTCEQRSIINVTDRP